MEYLVNNTAYFLQGEGEDLFGDNMENDYQPIPELDTYEDDIIDTEEYDAMSPGARQVFTIVLTGMIGLSKRTVHVYTTITRGS